jgi:hypothetical protein
MAQVVKYLPSKYKALNSNPVIHSVPDPSLLKDFVEPTSLGLSILRCSAQFCVFIDITVWSMFISYEMPAVKLSNYKPPRFKKTEVSYLSCYRPAGFLSDRLVLSILYCHHIQKPSLGYPLDCSYLLSQLVRTLKWTRENTANELVSTTNVTHLCSTLKVIFYRKT